MAEKYFLCIDLKSFYASVECITRGLDPFKTNLVVSDPDRGKGAITLAATPAIKKLGVKSRGRIFEIPKHIKYIIAPPRMSLYMEYSAMIYKILLKYIASEDIHVYSIDESFIDITPYMSLYQISPRELAKRMLEDIFQTTKLTATVGIGTNLFLAKVALDVCAKHSSDGIAYLDDERFKKTMWHHRPITDIWMIGPGIARRLDKIGVYDLYGITTIAKPRLEKLFGVNAQVLIDHAWGREPVEIKDIKNHSPKTTSISNSQILFSDYNFEEAFLILKEMVDTNVLLLNKRKQVTNHISLYIGYSKDVRKASSSSIKINTTSNSYQLLMAEFKKLYFKIVDPNYPIHKIGISLGNLKDERFAEYDLFVDVESIEKEHRLQIAINDIHYRYGKNALLKGMNFLDKATQRYRNMTIGGHKSG